jgi:hypothetical protein
MQEREEAGRRLVEKLSEEVARMHSAVAEERRARETRQNEMVRRLEEVQMMVNMEIEREVIERRENEENLLHLLEETCIRVEKTIFSNN